MKAQYKFNVIGHFKDYIYIYLSIIIQNAIFLSKIANLLIIFFYENYKFIHTIFEQNCKLSNNT